MKSNFCREERKKREKKTKSFTLVMLPLFTNVQNDNKNCLFFALFAFFAAIKIFSYFIGILLSSSTPYFIARCNISMSELTSSFSYRRLR